MIWNQYFLTPITAATHERQSASNHRRFDCMLKSLFSSSMQGIIKLRNIDLCERNPLVTDGFLSQGVINVECISMLRRQRAS